MDIWIDIAAATIIGTGIYLWLNAQKKILKYEREQNILEAKRVANEYMETSRRQIDELTRAKEQIFLEKENTIGYREGAVALQLQSLLEREHNLQHAEAELNLKKQEQLQLQQQLQLQKKVLDEKIEQAAHISTEEARKILLEKVEKESFKEALATSKRIIDDAKDSAKAEAMHILGIALERCAIAHQTDIDSTIVNIPNKEIKGRIIGRDGRNIRSFENNTGVTVLIDNDSPHTIILSSFEPVRREVARRAMMMLIDDGRISPSRIEVAVEQARNEIDDECLASGNAASNEVGIGALPPNVARTLGKLKYRRSMTQNVLAHSTEVGILAGLIAGELGQSEREARMAGLLHDIGKGLGQEYEGSHAEAGARFLKENGFGDEVVEAVKKHHSDEDSGKICPICSILKTADAMSATRPGARKEEEGRYLQRCEEMENIANQLPGVKECCVLQAGRELRVYVNPKETTDEQCEFVSRHLCNRIQERMQYQGQITITIIREHRWQETAR